MLKPRAEGATIGERGADAAPDTFLEWAEDVLIRMNCGVYKFIFIKVPREAYRALVRCFPTIVRLIKVICLLAVLLTSIFAPSIIALSRQGILGSWPMLESHIPAWYLARASVWDVVAYSYTTLALLGSLWGALYLRRRFKKRSAAAPARLPLPQ